MLRNIFFIVLVFVISFSASATKIYVFGPGGPHTAIIDAAKVFEKKTGDKVIVTFGPQAKWQIRAEHHADIIYGSSEQSMFAILKTLKHFNIHEVMPLYLRPAAIMVRHKNPKHIKGLNSLATRKLNVVVVEGGGVSNTSGTGVWEDMIGRTKNISKVRKFRHHIKFFAPNSGAARKAWQSDKKLDAWITWIDWTKDNKNIGDYVAIEPNLVIYRDVNVALADNASPAAHEFVKFLTSRHAKSFFTKRGWF